MESVFKCMFVVIALLSMSVQTALGRPLRDLEDVEPTSTEEVVMKNDYISVLDYEDVEPTSSDDAAINSGENYDYVASQEKDYQYFPALDEEHQFIDFYSEGERILEEPRERGFSGDVPSWFRSQVQDIPIWLLSLIMVAISGIIVVLIFGCVCVTKSCWRQRSKTNKIAPLIEVVIGEHMQLRGEKKQHFMPSQGVIEEMLEQMLEERKIQQEANSED